MDADSEPQEEPAASVKRLLSKPLELLPERDDLTPPLFAVAGLAPLRTNNHFKPLEEILEMKSTQATLTVARQLPIEELFRQTIYQKYECPLREGPNSRIIRCQMSKANQQPPRIVAQLMEPPQEGANDVKFDSKFESGNLGRVSRLSSTQFNLLVDNDINTKGFTQWFFFQVDVQKQCRLRFNILNFRKKCSLFQRGMKVCVFSRARNQQLGEGWVRAGTDITYQRSSLSDTRAQFTLSFSYESKMPRDSLLFSYHYPYTYSDLQRFYHSLAEVKCVKRSLLCLTPCHNKLHCLTITETFERFSPLTKKYVFVLARAHPGETIGSMLIERLVRYLTSNEREAVELRHMYIWKIVPMINPDGVLHGNSRCSLPGRDLNRSWQKPDANLFPEVFFIKKMITEAQRHSTIEMVCDFHGHSLKKDAFIYGCHKKNHPFATRQFPWVMSRLCKNFNFSQCAFTNAHGSKSGTARMSLFRALKIPNVFTLETSFCGPSRSIFHWSQDDLKELAKCFCQALHLLGKKPKPARKSVAHGEKVQLGEVFVPQVSEDHQKHRLLSQLYSSKDNYECNLREQESESDVQLDYIDQDVFAIIPSVKKGDRPGLSEDPDTEKHSKSTLAKRQRLESMQISSQSSPKKLIKGRIAKKKPQARHSSDRVEEFDNIRFWVGNQQEKVQRGLKTREDSSPSHNNKSLNLRKGYHSRTETNPPDSEHPVPRDIQFDLLHINLRIPKTPEKLKRVATEFAQQSLPRRRHSKDISTLSILPQKLERLSKKYSPVVYNPQRRYIRLQGRTEQLRRQSPETNFIAEKQQDRKVFERQLIDRIDRRLQNYIQVYKMNRFNEDSMP